MTPTLPPLIDRFVAAVNRGNTGALLSFFPKDGVVDDWDRRFVGHDAIRRWSDDEFIGAKGRITILDMTENGPELTLIIDWKSTFYSGKSRIVFVVDGDRIREMRINAA